jgi:hypothetical protein
MNEIDGILGMTSNFKNGGPLFIEALKDRGLITNSVFGFYLSGTDGRSFLDIGVLWNTSMRNKDELIWMDAIRDFWWSNYVTGIRFINPGQTDKSKVTSFRTIKKIGTTDTGTSCTYVP